LLRRSGGASEGALVEGVVSVGVVMGRIAFEVALA
jgi:hypothetical protein